MMMARAVPDLRCDSDKTTGAARTRFLVNTAAVGTSSAAAIIARSGPRLFLMPQGIPANLNPGQATSLIRCAHSLRGSIRGPYGPRSLRSLASLVRSFARNASTSDGADDGRGGAQIVGGLKPDLR